MIEPQQTLTQFVNGMIQLMLVKFMVNDIPHAAGLLTANPGNPATTPSSRLQELKKYTHTVSDMRRIAAKTGLIKLYHGAPTEFAELLVKHGPTIPYKVEDTARYVARTYGLVWLEFRPYAYRVREVVTRLSTATAPVAARWAWSFPLGEVLTDLNSHARMLVEAKKVARVKDISTEDAYEELHEQAMTLAKETGIQYNFDNAPDILGLQDKLALQQKTGALVELVVDGRALSDHAVRSASQILRDLDSGEMSEAETLALWNHQYHDIKIAPGNIKSARIVISGMERWEQDAIEDMIKQELAAAEGL